MGCYIEVPMSRGKANHLIKEHGAREISAINPKYTDAKEGEVIVCVMDNGPFEAAGVAYSEDEFNVFNHEDGRFKRFLVLSREKVFELAPSAVHYMK